MTGRHRHQLSLFDAKWPTASDGLQPLPAADRTGAFDPQETVTVCLPNVCLSVRVKSASFASVQIEYRRNCGNAHLVARRADQPHCLALGGPKMNFMRAFLLSVFVVGLFPVASQSASIAIAPGASPAGTYLDLISNFGISPIAGMGDNTIVNFDVAPFVFAGGGIWDKVGVSSNGYVVVGGGTSADNSVNNTSLPSFAAPGPILAPFWTDLNPAAGGAVSILQLTDGVNFWEVIDWSSVPILSDSTKTNSFEIWIGQNGIEDISFSYGVINSTGNGGFLTVGAQDASRTVGGTLYFNGSGVLPASGNEFVLTSTPGPYPPPFNPVPEPASIALLSIGLAGFAVLRRRKPGS